MKDLFCECNGRYIPGHLKRARTCLTTKTMILQAPIYTCMYLFNPLS